MDNSTERFIELLEAQNRRLAAQAAREAEQPEAKPDPIRLQREEERREKWGTLRAREQPSKRPHRARNVFDYVDLSHE